jgi:hypothetical protein
MARQISVPEIGLRGHIVDVGFLVTKAEAPSDAVIEKGDVILSVMGYPVCNDAMWERLTSGDNEYLRLGIIEKQTGERVTKYCRLSSRRNN